MQGITLRRPLQRVIIFKKYANFPNLPEEQNLHNGIEGKFVPCQDNHNRKEKNGTAETERKCTMTNLSERMCTTSRKISALKKL